MMSSDVHVSDYESVGIRIGLIRKDSAYAVKGFEGLSCKYPPGGR